MRMSIQSQQNNMRRLCDLLGRDLGYLHGEREGGPNGAKKTFLHVGRVFLRALAKDLGLRDAVVKSNAAGIAVSGECSLCGMWEEGGIYICLSQFAAGGERALCRLSLIRRRECPALPHHPQPEGLPRRVQQLDLPGRIWDHAL